ncbi:glycosyltransferase family 2 protein [Psychroserpens luteolus]|uniref:glycosyltransferase family 2 protein n=1 Tax=Psychroserpens luteolus TaxID=2855840 RepID=UPI001E49A1D3|nr:glycosyltransferase family 2 protein [Psychroserpens luteolus]MCD2259789.1 glycosyltransferase family 2 protein [Psychroserpens luteolus]
MIEQPEISVVSPVYKAEGIITELVQEIDQALSPLNIPYEIVLVDDSSPDNSWTVMKSLALRRDNLKVFKLSRNFGQHPTIMAGLSKAEGRWTVVMDCDLQDKPSEIPKLYEKAQEGFDSVLAKRSQRKDGFFKKIMSKWFYKCFAFFTNIEVDKEVANFGIYNQKVIKSILSIGDALVFFPLFVKWVGFKQTSIEVEHSKRSEGKSSYSFFMLLKLAFNTIISFSDKPLRLFLNIGLITSFLSFIGAIRILIKALNGEIEILGYSSIFISICFFSGIIISVLGVIGIYLGKTFNQSKSRPLYIIDDEPVE